MLKRLARLSPVLLLLIGALPSYAQDAADATTQRPSVLFINVDDLNDWNQVLGGHPQALTPNLAALAERGMTFSRAVCASPVCFPSRTALMTGIHPANTGVISNFNWGRPWRYYVPEAVTLPMHLANHGYSTVGGGKNFHNADAPEFDTYFRRPREPAVIPDSGYRLGDIRWGVTAADPLEMPDARVVTWGIDRLGRAEADEPLLLSIGIYRPHVPWVVPQQYFDRHPLDELQLPETIEGDVDDLPQRLQLLTRNEAKFGLGYHQQLVDAGQDINFVRAYLACVSFADDQLGRLIEAWDNSPHAENGYIVLWSDHGYMLSEKSAWSKMKPWYDACHSNLMVIGPGIEPGSVCGRAVSLLDVYPTLVELLDLPLPDAQALDGNSLAPLLSDPDTDWDRPVVMSHEADGIRYDTVLGNRYRLTRTITGETELYDHDQDPHEWHNLARDPSPEHQAVIDRLCGHLSFTYPAIPADGWVEAEDIPTQSASDHGLRGNFHFPLAMDGASGGRVVHAQVPRGAGCYIDFVLQIDRPGTYRIEAAVQHIQPGTFVAYFDTVRPLAAQADHDFEMPRLENAIAAPADAGPDNRPVETITLGEAQVTDPGLHILRFMREAGDNPHLRVDRIRLLPVEAPEP